VSLNLNDISLYIGPAIGNLRHSLVSSVRSTLPIPVDVRASQTLPLYPVKKNKKNLDVFFITRC
jgi:hypothetical protein